MWDPFCHDWDAMQERAKLEKICAENENATISIDIPIELFLKLAEQSDEAGSLMYGYYGCMFNNADEVENYINEILEEFVSEKTKETGKVLSKIR